MHACMHILCLHIKVVISSRKSQGDDGMMTRVECISANFLSYYTRSSQDQECVMGTKIVSSQEYRQDLKSTDPKKT
jgi:hypothetical protein